MRSQSECSFDRWIRRTVSKYGVQIFIIIMIAVSLCIRILLIPCTDMSPDYTGYITGWMDAYRQQGIIAGLADSIPGDDYYIPMNLVYAVLAQIPLPYYVTISAFSCMAEYVSVFFLYKIFNLLLLEKNAAVYTGDRKRAALCAVSVLYLPAAIWNGAYWKQCDAVYTCFAVISLYYLLREKYSAAVIWLAVSFSFKLQAVFLFPFFIAVYLIQKKFSILHFLWLPAVYLAAGFPAVFCHRGLKATYLIYYYQTQETTSYKDYGMNSFFPNIYAFGLDDFAKELQKPAVLAAGVICLGAVMLVWHYRMNVNRQKLVLLCFWMMQTCCVFLPGMHERYDYPVLLLGTAYVLFIDHRLVPAMIVMNCCSFITYTIVMQNRMGQNPAVTLPAAAVFYLAAYAYITVAVIRELRLPKEDMEVHHA
jgi:Gpi18-like mannosyltransferase